MNHSRKYFALLFLVCASLLDASERVAAAVQHIQQKDYAEARAILTPLADGGSAEAQYYLGLLYENGWSVARDLVQAHVLYNRSAAKQHAHTEAAVAARDRIEGSMSKEDVERAERLAAGGSSAPSDQGQLRESPVCRELFSAAKLLAAGQKLGTVEANQYTDLGDVCEAPTLTIGKSWSYSFCMYGDKPKDSHAVSFCFEGVTPEVVREAISSCAGGASGIKMETLSDDLHFSIGNRPGMLLAAEFTYPKRVLVRGTWRRFTSCINLYVESPE